MTVYSYSGKGNRETNEDYIRSVQFDNNTSLHIVADGMGGYLYGEIAAQVAADAIVQFISERHYDENITSTIQQAVKFANEEIALKRKSLHAKLGTTIAGVFIQESTAYAFWLGDVQIHLFRDNKQLFISESHSLINEMKSKGNVSVNDIRRYSNVVTKSLMGNELEFDSSVKLGAIKKNDIIFISTDGFWQNIQPENILDVDDIELIIYLDTFKESIQDNYSFIKIII